MMDLEVESRRRKVTVADTSKARYLVLGDFGGRRTEPVAVDRDNIDQVLAKLDVNLAGMRMNEVEDFHPDHLYARIEEFRELDEPEEDAPRPLSSPKPKLDEILKRGSLLEQIAGGGDPFQQYLRDLARAHAAPAKKDNTARNKALSEQMGSLLHHPRFQAIEAAWRGLDLVVRNADDDASRVFVAQFSREDLRRDLEDAKDLSATEIHRLFTSREWKGIFGLYSFASSSEDIELLGRLALLAAHANAPFVAEGSVEMGDHWDELRAIPEAKYLGLALPRLLLRLPYGAKSSAIESFPFEEMPGKPVHADYLWGSPAWAVLAVIARAPDGEDLDLDHLPVHTYEDDGDWKMTPCAEVWIKEAQVHALMELGLIPLVSFRDDDRVRLAGLRAIDGSPLV